MLEFMLHLRFRIGVYARLRKDSVLITWESAFESTRDYQSHIHPYGTA